MLVELTKVEGTKYGVLIAEQIQDVAVRVQSVRHFAVSQMVLLVQNVQPLLQVLFCLNFVNLILLRWLVPTCKLRLLLSSIFTSSIHNLRAIVLLNVQTWQKYY